MTALTTPTFRRVLLIIVLGALALRVGYVLLVTQYDTGFYDAVFYELEAKTVADGRGFVGPLPGAYGGGEAADHPPLTVAAASLLTASRVCVGYPSSRSSVAAGSLRRWRGRR